MQALQLRVDLDAPKLAENHEGYHMGDDITFFESGLYDLLMEPDTNDPIVTNDDVEVVIQTGAIPVDRIDDWDRVFSNIGCTWLEEAYRYDGFNPDEEVAKVCYAVSEGWYDLARALKSQQEVINRLTSIQTIVSYETR